MVLEMTPKISETAHFFLEMMNLWNLGGFETAEFKKSKGPIFVVGVGTHTHTNTHKKQTQKHTGLHDMNISIYRKLWAFSSPFRAYSMIHQGVGNLSCCPGSDGLRYNRLELISALYTTSPRCDRIFLGVYMNNMVNGSLVSQTYHTNLTVDFSIVLKRLPVHNTNIAFHSHFGVR